MAELFATHRTASGRKTMSLAVVRQARASTVPAARLTPRPRFGSRDCSNSRCQERLFNWERARRGHGRINGDGRGNAERTHRHQNNAANRVGRTREPPSYPFLIA